MAEELNVKLQVDNEEGQSKLEDFATRLAAVTAGVAALQTAVSTDKGDTGTYGKQARKRVKDYGEAVDRIGAKEERLRKRRRRKASGGALGKEATAEVNELGEAIDSVTESAQEYLDTIEDAEAGKDLFGKDIQEDVDAMSASIKELNNSATDAVTALANEGFTFNADDLPDEVEAVNVKIADLEKLIDSTKEKLATAQDNQAFGADVRDEIAQLEETLSDAEAAITKTKAKIAEGPKGPFPVKFTDKMKEAGDVIGDLLPKQFKMLKRGFKDAKGGTQSFTKGLNGMKKALISTGIGALVVLLGELVANWDNITAAINSASDESQALLDSANGMREQADKQAESIEATTNQMLLQGKTEEDIAAMKAQALDDQILAAELQVEYTKAQAKEQKETIERNKKIAMGVLAALQSPVVLLLGVIDAVTEAMAAAGILSEKTTLANDYLSMQAEALGFTTEETDKENQERIDKAEEDLNKLKERAAAREVKRRREQAADEAKAGERRKKELEEQGKFLDQLLIKEQEYGKSQDELAVMRLKRQQEDDMQRARDLGLGLEELARLEAQHNKELEDLEKKQADKRAKTAEEEKQKVMDAMASEEDLRVAQVTKEYDELIALAEKYGLDTTALEEKREAELKAIRDKAAVTEKSDAEKLQRELELLNMGETAARFERERDDAEARFEERMLTAAGNQELERQVREQFEQELTAINNREAASFVQSRMDMVDSIMNFGKEVQAVGNSIQAMSRANMEAEKIEAKARNASDSQMAKLEKKHAAREKRMALMNVLFSQAQSIASAIQGATMAAANTGPAAPIVTPILIAQLTGIVLGGFAQVKQIMNKASAVNIPSPSSAGGGGGGRPMTDVLDPNLVTDLGNRSAEGGRDEESFKAYVVASEVQGQNADYGNIVQNASL